MKTFILLLKKELRNNFSNIGFKRKKNSATYSIIILLWLLIISSITIMAYVNGKFLIGSGAPLNRLISSAVTISCSFVLAYNMISSFKVIYKSKDYEFIRSLPINTGKVILSKLMSQILMQYIFISLIYVPYVLNYFIIGSFSFSGVISAIAVFLCIPMLPIIIGLSLGMLVNYIFGNLKYKKVIVIVLAIGVSIALIISMSSVDMVMGMIEFMSNGIYKVFSKINPLEYFAVQAISSGSITSLLFFVLINTVPIIVYTLLSSRYYNAMYSYFNRSAEVKIKSDIEFKNHSVFNVLLRKEFKRLFSSTSYFLISTSGPFGFILISISIAMITNYNLGDIYNYSVLIALSSLFLILITSPLTVTYSLEGETFYLVKSLPINLNQYLLAKITMQSIVYVPMILVGTLMLSIFMKISMPEFLLLFLLGVLFNFVSAFVGLLIARKHYNLQYTNEMQVVKYSVAVRMQILIGIGIYTVLLLVFILFKIFATEVLALILFEVIIIVMLVFLGKKVFAFDNSMLNEIE